jgi:hypothetical protein
MQGIHLKLNPGFPWQKQFSTRRLFSPANCTSRRELVKCHIWSMSLYGPETWTLRKIDQKYLESFKMRRWRKMEKISWTDRMKCEEVLHRVKKGRNILHTMKKEGYLDWSHLGVGTAC